MNYKNKAQVSLEYLIVTSLVLLFLVVMGVILYQKYSEWADLRTHLAGRSAANTVAESINQVVVSGDGYWQTFSVRSRYPGDEFNITFKRNEPTVFIDLQDMTMHAPLLTMNVTCCPPTCVIDGEKTILPINNTLSSRVINHGNVIFIGRVC
ncbi:MAG: hypothetical protein WAX07_10025 [Candidatus Altiarchaeia archaeon]